MERRRLARTEHRSTIAVLGGAAFWDATPDRARAAFDHALARGVDHLDIAPSYGLAEQVLGPLVAASRQRLFVAGKTMRTNPAGVRAQFDETRRLLGCEVLDLYQAHAVTSVAALDARAPALDAIVALREEGSTRFAGVTGHDHGAPAAHLEALRRWDLDTVMFPVNAWLWGDAEYRESAQALLDECARRDVGVLAIKAAARRPWSGGDRWATTWYEPRRDPADVADGIAFALSTPGVAALCTPGDLGLLPVVLDACEDVPPMDDAARADAIARSRAPGADAEIFPIPT